MPPTQLTILALAECPPDTTDHPYVHVVPSRDTPNTTHVVPSQHASDTAYRQFKRAAPAILCGGLYQCHLQNKNPAQAEPFHGWPGEVYPPPTSRLAEGPL
ncbi:hypothetical protein O181_104398 [Austropuccinia psidii MF-1]|uniref:Uncharacterized protein n=1 Tax=Austropuccinia psidii MF-1 TaxID=1389203 RepID=A0A9Q3JK22_9BASI|nr:hypothetical protein [Austropuccinia psidii MF-1]